MKDKDIKEPKKNKKLLYAFLTLLGVGIYLLGGVTFMSYVIIAIMCFSFGSMYRKLKVEYEDYKILKSVQKSMIKLDDYKLLQEENDLLKNKVNTLTDTLTSCMVGRATEGVPPNHARSYTSNLDKIEGVL